MDVYVWVDALRHERMDESFGYMKTSAREFRQSRLELYI